jgi:pre-rRNA-processing protein IPI3
MLLSASQDASVHVFLVSRLVDEDDAGALGKPYGTLKDHTLGIRNVAIGKTAGSHGGRCWTTSDDGTVKVCLPLPQLVSRSRKLTERCGPFIPRSTC